MPAALILSQDRKSTRLNSSHLVISYAVFCLKKKKRSCRTSAQVRCHVAKEGRLACVFHLAPPAGFEPAHTAPECTPVYSRYQRKRSPVGSLGARMGRAKSSSSASPSAAIDSHDPETIRCTNDHTCRSRTWHGCHAG